jgi:NAD(P)-dependent dehydrogenase (short-subunit alcohol dehydrogenase family)
MVAMSDFAFPLDGRVVLVTGGASGIGLATVQFALEGGAKVIVADRNPEALDALAKRPEAKDGRLIAEALDITDRDGVIALLEKVSAGFGLVDGLVCAAGISIEAPLMDVTPDLWLKHIEINLTGSFYIAQEVARRLVERKRQGAIVTVSSAQGFRGRHNSVPYVSSKAGIFGLTKAMAMDLAAEGVRVNCVAPGAVNTPLMQSVVAKAPGGIEAVLARIPMGRVGEPEDVARAICFLLSDAASWITGQTLHVNGGSLVV